MDDGHIELKRRQTQKYEVTEEVKKGKVVVGSNEHKWFDEDYGSVYCREEELEVTKRSCDFIVNLLFLHFLQALLLPVLLHICTEAIREEDMFVYKSQI